MDVNSTSLVKADVNDLILQNRFQDSIRSEVSPALQGVYNFVDSPWNNNIENARNVQLGSLAVESEKMTGTSKIEPSNKHDETMTEIANHIAVMAERTVVFHMFWGVVKKTQTEFKNMARGQ